MAEGATTIDQLNETLPPNNTILSEEDDQLRQFKIVLKNVFKGVNGNGFNKQIVTNEVELNYLNTLTSSISAQLTVLQNGQVPIGGILPFSGLISSIPPGFYLCTGANGTPNLTNKFIKGTILESSVGVAGGQADSVVVSHTHNADHAHTGSTGGADIHSHTLTHYSNPSTGTPGTNAKNAGPDAITGIFTSDPAGAHNHTAAIASQTVSTQSSGGSATNANLPAWVKLGFMMRGL